VNKSVNATREYVSINVLVVAAHKYLIKVLIVEYGGILSEHLEARREFTAFVGYRGASRKYNL